jgi:hypothetical protein
MDAERIAELEAKLDFLWKVADDGSLGLFLFEGGKLATNCSDVFYWACADAEFIEPGDYADLLQAIDECRAAYEFGSHYGDMLWSCRKRKMRPQGPYYRNIPVELWPLFNAAGPERTDPDGKQPTIEQVAEYKAKRLEDAKRQRELPAEFNKLQERNAAMSSYLRTHDHRLHDAAMAAAKEH